MADEKKPKEEKKTEFEKLLANLEERPVPERQCNIDDEECISCGS
jgi:ferredoxin